MQASVLFAGNRDIKIYECPCRADIKAIKKSKEVLKLEALVSENNNP
jgi:hypothetical protein